MNIASATTAGGEIIPVDLGHLSYVQRTYDGTALNAGDIARAVRAVLHTADTTIWSGSAADAFRDSCKDLPKLIDSVANSYGDAASALRGFVTELDQLTSRTTQYQQQHEQALTTRSRAFYAAQAAPTDAVLASDLQQRDDALQRFDTLGAQLHDEYLLAEIRCINALELARNRAIPPLKWWQHLIRTLERIVVIIGIVVTIIVGIVALVSAIALLVAGPEFLLIMAAVSALTTEAAAAITTELAIYSLGLGLADHFGINDEDSPSVGAVLINGAISLAPNVVGASALGARSGVLMKLNFARDGANVFRTGGPLVTFERSMGSVAISSGRYKSFEELATIPQSIQSAIAKEQEWRDRFNTYAPDFIRDAITRQRDTVVLVNSINVNGVTDHCVAIPTNAGPLGARIQPASTAGGGGRSW